MDTCNWFWEGTLELQTPLEQNVLPASNRVQFFPLANLRYKTLYALLLLYFEFHQWNNLWKFEFSLVTYLQNAPDFDSWHTKSKISHYLALYRTFSDSCSRPTVLNFGSVSEPPNVLVKIKTPRPITSLLNQNFNKLQEKWFRHSQL